MATKTQRALYRKHAKRSLCRRARTIPNKCEKIRHCKVAIGTKRKRYCRKRRATRYSKRKLRK